MNPSFEKCIKKLAKINVDFKEDEVQLRKKYKGRFQIEFAIDIGKIGNMKAGFDNHLNHQRPHVHIQVDKKTKISVAIDNGAILHKNKIKNKKHREISNWIEKRKECLKFIYEQIQNCRSKKDFEPVIKEMNKGLK